MNNYKIDENIIKYEDDFINLIQISNCDEKYYLDGFFKNPKCNIKYYGIKKLKQVLLHIIYEKLLYGFNLNSTLYLDTECIDSLVNYYKKLGFSIDKYNEEEDYYIMKINNIKTLLININKLIC